MVVSIMAAAKLQQAISILAHFVLAVILGIIIYKVKIYYKNVKLIQILGSIFSLQIEADSSHRRFGCNKNA